MSSRTWIILDSITKIQSQPLQTEQLQLAILKMSARDWTRFYVWTPGWQNWQLLKDFLKSDQKEFSLSGSPISEESVKKYIQEQLEDTITNSDVERSVTKSLTTINSKEETFTPASQDYKPPEPLNFKKMAAGYANRAERHELKIEILLSTAKGKTFKSYSKNISLSGTLLEDNIPFDFYGVQFDVVVINRNSLNPQTTRVHMRAETVGEGLTQRLRFIGQTEAQKQKLMTLLNDYISQQGQLKKSS